MMKTVGIILGVLLVTSLSAQAFADQYTEVRKKDEEEKAKQYQKDVLHFDYSKILKKTKGFKAPIKTEPKKKVKMQYIVKLKV